MGKDVIKDRLIDKDAFLTFRVEGWLVHPQIGQDFFCQRIHLLAVGQAGELRNGGKDG